MADCRIHCEVAAKLNFAAHQSAFPVLRELRVENLDARERIDDLVLALHASPAFLREKRWRVDGHRAPEPVSEKEDRGSPFRRLPGRRLTPPVTLSMAPESKGAWRAPS